MADTNDITTGSTNYMVVDGEGRALTSGLQGPEVCDEAAQSAQRWADRLRAPVWLVAADGPEGDQGERYDPDLTVAARVEIEGERYKVEGTLGGAAEIAHYADGGWRMAGYATLSSDGEIECDADLGDEVYDALQEAVYDEVQG